MIIVDGVVGKTLIQIYLLKSAINQEEHGLNQQMNLIILIITFLIAISISILDYLIPILGVKKLGGTKGGQIGASLGVMIGLFFLGPLGLIAGPFIGSLTGEFISKKNLKDSIYPALGSLIGTLAGTIIKFFVSMIFTIYFLYQLLESI